MSVTKAPAGAASKAPTSPPAGRQQNQGPVTPPFNSPLFDPLRFVVSGPGFNGTDTAAGDSVSITQKTTAGVKVYWMEPGIDTSVSTVITGTTSGVNAKSGMYMGVVQFNPGVNVAAAMLELSQNNFASANTFGAFISFSNADVWQWGAPNGGTTGGPTIGHAQPVTITVVPEDQQASQPARLVLAGPGGIAATTTFNDNGEPLYIVSGNTDIAGATPDGEVITITAGLA